MHIDKTTNAAHGTKLKITATKTVAEQKIGLLQLHHHNAVKLYGTINIYNMQGFALVVDKLS